MQVIDGIPVWGDPARFYQEDRDHFYFTIGAILAGRAGGYDKLEEKENG
jgi:hypothetical protein